MKYVKALAVLLFTPISQRNDPFKQSGAKNIQRRRTVCLGGVFSFFCKLRQKKTNC